MARHAALMVRCSSHCNIHESTMQVLNIQQAGLAERLSCSFEVSESKPIPLSIVCCEQKIHQFVWVRSGQSPIRTPAGILRANLNVSKKFGHFVSAPFKKFQLQQHHREPKDVSWVETTWVVQQYTQTLAFFPQCTIHTTDELANYCFSGKMQIYLYQSCKISITLSSIPAFRQTELISADVPTFFPDLWGLVNTCNLVALN